MTTQFNIAQAARIADVSRNTIKSHQNSGKLSYARGLQGEKLVDAAELMRVYGDKCDFKRVESGAASSSAVQSPAPIKSGQSDQHELVNLQLRLDLINEERKREREQLQQQIDHLQKSLEKALDGSNKAMLLLEHRPGGGDWDKRFEELERKIANQKVIAEKQAAEAKEAGKREVITELKNKNWLFAMVDLLRRKVEPTPAAPAAKNLT
jgi:hypothetical protein